MITFENVVKTYGDTRVLNNLSFEIAAGEFTVLIGPSGCGKTTTLRTVNRLIEPDSGRIFINGQDILQMDKVALRRSIGYVIQQIGLFPHMTVQQNICVVPKLLRYDKSRCDEIAHEMLSLVNMPYEKYAHKYPYELSGGQQQRIGVLRALAASPPIVLMDEPFGALDPITRSILQEEIKKLQRKLNKTIVFVTHDMDEALFMADKIIFMEKGNIVQMASPEEMLENPASELISSFMGKRVRGSDQSQKTAADVMIPNVYTCYRDYGVRESIEIMARRSVDSLVVLNPDQTYAGTVSVRTIRDDAKQHKTIETLIRQDNPTVFTDEDAQECFQKLLDGSYGYLVVLRSDRTLAGIVTKTSVARALADLVWGDNGSDVI